MKGPIRWGGNTEASLPGGKTDFQNTDRYRFALHVFSTCCYDFVFDANPLLFKDEDFLLLDSRKKSRKYGT